MWIVKGTISLAVSLAMIAIVTAALWYAKLAGVVPHHPVFFYLLPIAAIAILFGMFAAMLSAAAATACAAFFFYDPVYSFYVANTLEWGDLICFVVLAAMGVKCTVDLLRPGSRLPRKPARAQSWDAS